MAKDSSEQALVEALRVKSSNDQMCGIWMTTLRVVISRWTTLVILFLSLAILKIQVVIFPFFFMGVLAPVDGFAWEMAKILALYVGCAWDFSRAEVSWNWKQILDFMFKVLLLAVLIEFSGSWYFSPENNTMFGGEVRLTELSQDDEMSEFFWVLCAFLTKWLWTLSFVVLLGTGLPAALIASKQGFKRTLARGYVAAVYIISRTLIGPIPVLAIAIVWAGIISELARSLVPRLNLDPSQKIEFLSYTVMLSLVNNTIVFLAYVMLGIVLSRGYQLGERRLEASS
ncbi:hypothetical protein [Thalassospira lohafexi]|uniref:Transmembrane protein n=1 Tax=Thalassospira lohafexi TaxID=744227 RepID=A0A2N3L231_9PROT|nr:hypothetical protein [Thalassospira lohafexi]PKR56874.1 hypothetical protein COO92_17950 [Thalassospira lohafexi]